MTTTKPFILIVAIWLSLPVLAYGGLEEKTWRDLPDEFQLGYLWGLLDAAGASDPRMHDCLKAKDLSPANLQSRVNLFLRVKPVDLGDSIYTIAWFMIQRACKP